MMPGLPAPLSALLFALALAAAPVNALAQDAQGTKVQLGSLTADTSLPVEITSDSFSVDQADGAATFAGKVSVTQGPMHLTAAEIRVEYTEDGKTINRLLATGGVVLENGTDRAEAAEAAYTIASGEVIMSGDVRLSQGSNTMTGQRLHLDLVKGTGLMEGRVTTTFVPKGSGG